MQRQKSPEIQYALLVKVPQNVSDSGSSRSEEPVSDSDIDDEALESMNQSDIPRRQATS